MPTPTANNTAKAMASRSTCAMPTMACRIASALAAQRRSLDHPVWAPTLPPSVTGGGKRLAERRRKSLADWVGRISVLLTAVAGCQLGEGVGRNLVPACNRDAGPREGAQRGRPFSAFEQRALPQDGSR